MDTGQTLWPFVLIAAGSGAEPHELAALAARIGRCSLFVQRTRQLLSDRKKESVMRLPSFENSAKMSVVFLDLQHPYCCDVAIRAAMDGAGNRK
jgi:hypothetical protein